MGYSKRGKPDQTGLSTEEIEELRRRIESGGADRKDVRAAGAVTISDVAEAYSLSPEEVQAHLDRLRAEEAFAGEKVKARSQKGLLALAIVLLATAYGIYLVRPHAMTEEEQDQLIERLNSQRTQRKRTMVKVFPVVETLDLGAANPPVGFSVQIFGSNTVTAAKPSLGLVYLPLDDLKAKLVQSVLALSDKAEELDRQAPPPPQDAKFNSSGMPGVRQLPGTYCFEVWGGSIRLNGSYAKTPNPLTGGKNDLNNRKSQIEEAVSKGLGAAIDAAQNTVSLASGDGRILRSSPGFGFHFHGRTERLDTNGALPIIPQDALAYGQHMELVVRRYLWSDVDPDDAAWNAGAMSSAQSPPLPKITKVEIVGPIRTLEYEFPTAASDKYPTAADAKRAADAMLKQVREDVRRQVEEINRGGVPSTIAK